MSISIATEEDIPEIISLIETAYKGRRGFELYRPYNPNEDQETGGSKGKGEAEGWAHERGIIGGPRIDEKNPWELYNSENVRVLKYSDSASGKILGCVRLEKVGEGEEGKCYLGLLSVEPGEQTRGIGSKLLEASEMWAKERKCSCIELTVISIRDSLIDYYKRRGYQNTGEIIPFTETKGLSTPLVPLHLILLKKSLANP